MFQVRWASSLWPLIPVILVILWSYCTVSLSDRVLFVFVCSDKLCIPVTMRYLTVNVYLEEKYSNFFLLIAATIFSLDRVCYFSTVVV